MLFRKKEIVKKCSEKKEKNKLYINFKCESESVFKELLCTLGCLAQKNK
jgi:hypothetical protein